MDSTFLTTDELASRIHYTPRTIRTQLKDAVLLDVAPGLADLESYGQFVLANPDFVARLKAGAPLNTADRTTFFGGTAKGYTDYPALRSALAV